MIGNSFRMLFHDFNSCQFRAGFQVMHAETGRAAGSGALVKSEGGWVSALGQARGARVQAIDPVHVGFGGENVGVAREIGVGLIVAEQVGVVKVTVAQKQAQSVFFDFGKVGEAGESQHHLVHLGVAVPAHSGDDALEGAEQFGDALRVVSAGERVPWAVVQKVPQQEYAVAAEFFEVGQRHLAGVGGTVDVGKDEGFHNNSESRC